MTDQELYQYIDDYLGGRFSDPEKSAFEKRLQDDPAFKKEFELHRDLQQQMQKNKSVQDLKQIIAEVTNEAKPKKSNPNVIYILIGLIVLLLTAFFLFFNKKPAQSPASSPQNIYLALYETYPAHPILRSAQDSSQFKQAMLAYAENDYTKTIQILKAQNIWQINELNLFYQALSQMELGEYNTAKSLFAALLKKDLFDLKEPVLWYHSLIYLRNNQLDSAQIFYERLPSTSVYRKKGEDYFKRFEE